MATGSKDLPDAVENEERPALILSDDRSTTGAGAIKEYTSACDCPRGVWNWTDMRTRAGIIIKDKEVACKGLQ